MMLACALTCVVVRAEMQSFLTKLLENKMKVWD